MTTPRKQKAVGHLQVRLTPQGACTSVAVEGLPSPRDYYRATRSSVDPETESYDSKFLELIAGLNPAADLIPRGAMETADGSLALLLSTGRRPTRADLGGLDGKQTRQIFLVWWANHDSSTPVAPWWKTPLHSDSRFNRAVRAWMRSRFGSPS